jgi:16S rRNA (adenine1518-N6/adenine1519-N6)-dimethyltransferase
MSSPKEILKKYRISPSKRLGQSFLIDKRILRKIIEVAELSKNDIVLEVGPGIGNLTKELAKRVKKVIAIEKDKRMVEILKKEVNFPNVQIVYGDILKIDLKSYKLKAGSYKIVANIPYYLTSRLIRKFLELENKPKLIVLMVQKEVAQRICASPPHQKFWCGGKPPKMNLLAVSVQFYAKPEIVSFVSKNSFWPRPKVDSAIIKIKPLIDAGRRLINADLFFKIVKAGFSQPRKQLINNLSKNLGIDKMKVKEWLLKNEIEPSQRAETLKIEDWLKLIKNFKLNGK